MRWSASLALAGIFLFAAAGASAQFSPALLQNASYWHDGKSEIDFYSADLVEEGQHYQSELLMILTAETVEPVALTRAQESNHPATLPVLHLHAQTSLARGLLLEQRSLEALWRMDSAALSRLCFTGSDGLGHILQSVREQREGSTITWKYSCDTYRRQVERPPVSSPNGTVVFYDELPMRVRMIDLTQPTGTFEIQLAHSIVSAKEQEVAFKPATVSYKVEERAINVAVQQGDAVDHFVMDRDFPFLLRQWKMADGSLLKLKNSIKADFANYAKPGDRERALKDPMLRHPD